MEQYDYDAFGFPYFYNRSGDDIHSSPWGNRFLFTGREWISELRTYDFRNRMYQPELGRFLQPDPMEFSAGDYNLYRYCHNDPVNKTDPFGFLDIIYQGYPANGPGNLARVKEAINIMRTTPQGRMLLDSPGTMTILPTGKDANGVYHGLGVGGYKGNFQLYLDPTHPLFYDKEVYRSIYKHHPEEKTPDTAEGRASVIDHELGHGVLALDDENKAGGTNVHDNENVFRSQLKPPMDPRKTYGGVRVKIDKKKE